MAAQIVADQIVLLIIASIDCNPVLRGGMRDNIGNVALDRLRRDAMLLVKGPLLFAPPLSLGHGAFHRASDSVGVEDHPPIDIACRAANRLNK